MRLSHRIEICKIRVVARKCTGKKFLIATFCSTCYFRNDMFGEVKTKSAVMTCSQIKNDA